MNRSASAITLAAFILGALVFAPETALAQGDNEAEAAFREGRRLLDAGSLEQACAKFADSQRLEPAAGTLLNLGDCFERRGMYASAFRSYKEAAAAATLRGRMDWQKLAAERMTGIAGKIPTIVLRVPESSRVRGLLVEVDGHAVDLGARELREQVDPGNHTIVASAPGFASWQRSVAAGGPTPVSIEVPRLIVDEREPKGEAPLVRPASGSRWQTVTGLIVGGVGLGVLALGGVAGVLAINAKDDATSKCPAYPDRCTPEGTATNERAQTWATVSTVTLIAGGVLTAGGVTLLLTAPSGRGPSTALELGPGRVGLRATF